MADSDILGTVPAADSLIKSKARVQQHGEVFTPPLIVGKMLDLAPIAAKVTDVHATFFEPSFGEGAFLVEILRRRLDSLGRTRYGRGGNLPYDALFAVSTLYGIEYLADNVSVARERMYQTFAEGYEGKCGRPLLADSDIAKSVRVLLRANLVQGDALTHRDAAGGWIVFSEWRQMGRGKRRYVKRTPFYYDDLFCEEEPAVVGLFPTLDEGKPGLPTYDAVKITEIWRLKTCDIQCPVV